MKPDELHTVPISGTVYHRIRDTWSADCPRGWAALDASPTRKVGYGFQVIATIRRDDLTDLWFYLESIAEVLEGMSAEERGADGAREAKACRKAMAAITEAIGDPLTSHGFVPEQGRYSGDHPCTYCRAPRTARIHQSNTEVSVPDANTLIRYMYRDDDNYKEYAEVIFKGAITDDERTTLIGALDDGELFEPDRVGLESARGWEDDCGHTANELLTSEIAVVERPPTDDRTISEFVAALVTANNMPKFKLTGNYGTFVIQRVVEAADEDAAFEQTGICTTLEAAGWTIVETPDGEEWDIEAVHD